MLAVSKVKRSHFQTYGKQKAMWLNSPKSMWLSLQAAVKNVGKVPIVNKE